MSVEFQQDSGEEQLYARRRVLIELAKKSGLKEPEQTATDAEDILDGQTQRSLIKERGWTIARYTVASALRVLYQDADVRSRYFTEIEGEDVTVGRLDKSLDVSIEGSEDGEDSESEPTDALRLPRTIENLYKNILDKDQQQMLARFSDAKIDFMALEMGKVYHEHARSQQLINRHVSHMRQLMRGVAPRVIAKREGYGESVIYADFLYKLPRFYELHSQRIVEAFQRINEMPDDVEGPSDEQLLFDETILKIKKPAAPREPKPCKATERQSPKVPNKPSQKRTGSKRTSKDSPKDDNTLSSLDENFANLDSTGVYMKQTGKRALLKAHEEVELAKDIELGLYAERKLAWLEGEAVKGFEGKRRYPLNTEQMREYRKMVRQGEKAKAHLMEANLRLVISIAKRYTGRGVDFQDLIQEGNLGLMRAVEKFDYTKGFKFSTYATWWIRQGVTRGLADQSRTIRLPIHLVEKVNKISKLQRELHQTLGRDATVEELAAESGIPADTIEDILDYSRNTISLDMPVGSDEQAPLGDFIEDEEGADPANATVNVFRRQDIDRLLALLDEREADVVSRRMGLHDGRVWKLEEVGKVHSLTKERIRQIESIALEKLRQSDETKSLQEYA